MSGKPLLRIVLLCVCAATGAQSHAQIQGPQGPPQVTAQQFADYALRFIRYTTAARSQSGVGIALLYGSDVESRAVEIERELGVRGSSVFGTRISVTKIPVNTTSTSAVLHERLRALRPAALIAVDIPSTTLNGAAASSRALRALSISTRREDLTMLSLAIVAEVSAGRTQIRTYRNSDALSRERVRFPADVLALTRAVTNDALENYRQGIRAFDFDEWREVRTRMEAALQAESDNPQKIVVIYGLRLQAYVPSLYLGMALAEENNCTEAARLLTRYTRNAAGLTEEERQLLNQYRRACKMP